MRLYIIQQRCPNDEEVSYLVRAKFYVQSEVRLELPSYISGVCLRLVVAREAFIYGKQIAILSETLRASRYAIAV